MAAGMNVGQVYATIDVDTSRFNAGMSDAYRQMQTFNGLLAKAQQLAMGFLSFQGFMALSRSLVATGLEVESFRVKLEVSLQDAAKAAERYKQAMDFALSTPFESADTVQAITDLSLLNYGNIEEGLRGIGNVAMVFGRQMGEVSQALYIMNSIVMRRFGMEIDRAGSQWAIKFRGKVFKPISNDLEGLRKLFIEIGNTELSGGIEKGADTLRGAWAQFEDQIERVKVGIMDTGGVTDYLKNTVQILTSEFENWRNGAESINAVNAATALLRDIIDGVANGARALGQVFQFVAENAETLKALIIGIAGAKIWSGITSGFGQLQQRVEEYRKSLEASETASSTVSQSANNAANAAQSLAGGMNAVAQSAAVSARNLGDSVAAFDSIAVAMSRFNTNQGRSPFPVMTEGMEEAQKAIAAYQDEFAQNAGEVEKNMSATLQYIETEKKLKAALDEEAATVERLKNVNSSYGRGMQAKEIEAEITAIKKKVAALKEEANALKEAAIAEQQRIAASAGLGFDADVQMARISKDAGPMVRELDNAQKILQGTGEAMSHVNNGVKEFGRVGRVFPEMNKRIGQLTGSYSKFITHMKTAALTTAAFSAAGIAIKMVTDEMKAFDLAANGVKLTRFDSLSDSINKVQNELKNAQGRVASHEQAINDALNGSLNPLTHIKALFGDIHGNQLKSLEILKGQEESLKQEEKVVERLKKLSIPELTQFIDNNAAALSHRQRNVLMDYINEMTKKTEEAKEAAKKAVEETTKVDWAVDAEGELKKFETRVITIVDNTHNTVEKAIAEAGRMGVDSTSIVEAAYQDAADKIDGLLKEVEKKSPAFAESLRRMLPQMLDFDMDGTLGRILPKVESVKKSVEDLTDKWKDMAKYYKIPEDAIVPVLKKYQSKLPILSEGWKKVKDTIDDATDAQRKYLDELEGRTEDILSRMKEAIEKGNLSPAELDKAIRGNLPAIMADVARDLSDLFKDQSLSAAQKYGLVVTEMQKRLEELGITSIRVGKDFAGFAWEVGANQKALEATGRTAEQMKKIFGKDWKVKEVKAEFDRNMPFIDKKNLLFSQKDMLAVFAELQRQMDFSDKMAPDANLYSEYNKLLNTLSSGMGNAGNKLSQGIDMATGAALKAGPQITSAWKSGIDLLTDEQKKIREELLAQIKPGEIISRAQYEKLAGLSLAMAAGQKKYQAEMQAGIEKARNAMLTMTDPAIERMKTALNSLKEQSSGFGVLIGQSFDGVKKASITVGDDVYSAVGKSAEELESMLKSGQSLKSVIQAAFDGKLVTGKLTNGMNEITRMGSEAERYIGEMGNILTGSVDRAAFGFSGIEDSVGRAALGFDRMNASATDIADKMKNVAEYLYQMPEFKATVSGAETANAMKTLNEALEQENLSVSELIRVNNDLISRISQLEKTIASKDFSSQTEVNMTNNITTQQPAQKIRQELQSVSTP